MEDTNNKIIKSSFSVLFEKTVFAVFGIFIGALCAFASLPYGIMPFGISACTIRKVNRNVLFGIYLGVILIGITVISQPTYIAAVLLTIPMHITLDFLLPKRHKAITPILNSFMCLLLLYLTQYFQYGMLTFDIFTGVLGLVLGSLSTKSLERALDAILTKRNFGKYSLEIILLNSIILSGFSGYSIIGISPIRILAFVLILFYSQTTRKYFGCIAGLLLSLACSVKNPSEVYICLCASLCALLYSNLKIRSQYLKTAVFILSFSIFALYLKADIVTLAFISECAVASALYMLIPIKTKQKATALFSEVDNEFNCKANILDTRLTQACSSLSQIAKILKNKEAKENMDIYIRTNETADKICSACRRSSVCWGTEYSTTRDVFNKVANTVMKSGCFKEDYFPEYFLKSCIKSQRLSKAISQMAKNCNNEIIQEKTLLANRRLLANQYEGISAYIKDICDEVCTISSNNTKLTEVIEEYFSYLGQPVKMPSVYNDKQDLLCIHAEIKTNKRLFEKRISAEISELTGKEMVCREFKNNNGIYEITLVQEEKYSLTVAQINKNKDGEGVCGDSFSSFRSSNACHVLALSDGMGSGRQAEKISSLTLNILENLLKNGFREEKACNLVNSTLLLGGGGQSFSTLDMASVNLFTGKTDFYKLGAAPTLIVRENRAYEIFCRSLPAGIMEDSKLEHKNCKLKEGDTVIMLSDGIDITEKIISICKQNNAAPITLCEKLMELATVNGKAVDDITIAVARVNLKKSA